jgi:hypothetical protein
MDTLLLFCSDPLNPRVPDCDYLSEADAVARLNGHSSLIDFESLTSEGNAAKALRRVVDRSDECRGIYRGWMVTPAQYSQLYGALKDRMITLINSPEAFEQCHYLPRWYPLLEGNTPKSVWTSAPEISDMAQIMAKLSVFGDRPVIVKDWVKSRKHEWLDACFIPSAANQSEVERVVGRFLELQGDDLNVGLVFREFVEFERIGNHPKSGMPLTTEYRLFYVRGRPIMVSRYWDDGDYTSELPPLSYFNGLAQLIDSQFFTMDVAKTQTGEWMVMELGDAQVAALPDNIDAGAFVEALVNSVK